MKVLYNGEKVDKISDYMVRRGNLLIQVKPEELTIPTISGRCEICPREGTSLGYDLVFSHRVCRVCQSCYNMFCVRVEEGSQVGDTLLTESMRQEVIVKSVQFPKRFLEDEQES